MDLKSGNDSDNLQQQETPGDKKSQSALLVLLLILVGGFAYLYFFTGIIKPQVAQKAPEPTVSAPQAVKMPLPDRDGEPAKPEAKAPEKAAAPKTAAPVAATTTAPAAKTAAAPAKPTAPPVAKPVPAPVKDTQKANVAKPSDKKPQPVVVAADKKSDKTPAVKSEVKKPVSDAKKPVVVENSNVPAKSSVKKAATTDSWSIVVGNYVLEEALSADMVRVQKAGFVPVIKPSARKKTSMNRLFVSDFNDRATAQAALEKLKQLTSDAFIMERGGKFVVYAGSYSQSESALSEKSRLKAAGFSVTIQRSDIEIPAQSLSVGPFKNKTEADAALGRLKVAGIKAALSQK